MEQARFQSQLQSLQNSPDPAHFKLHQSYQFRCQMRANLSNPKMFEANLLPKHVHVRQNWPKILKDQQFGLQNQYLLCKFAYSTPLLVC